jgi:hypothetical protein|tara:strand:- start:779 stop:1255 length:477 start_codon:yes stop_codon:yes gene_type:complete
MEAEKKMSPEDDAKMDDELKKLFDAADAEATAEGAPDAPMAMEGAEKEAAGEKEKQEGEVEETKATEGVDLSPLMETLGATEERAKALYDAAQQIGKTQGKSPKELSDMIANDFDVLMQLEMIAARGEGGAMGGSPAPEMAPGGMGMPAGGMMPPEGM